MVAAFFVASEFALVKIRISRLEQLKNEGVKNAELAFQVTHHLDAYLSASQLGVTLTELVIGWVGEGSVADLLHPLIVNLPFGNTAARTISITLGFIIVTYVDVVMGELLPKSYSIVQTEKVVLAIVKPLHYFYKLMYPFIWLLNHSAARLGKLIGIPLVTEGEEILTQDELLLVAVESYRSGEITKEEYDYLENVFEFEDTLAREIQIDRTTMEVLESDETVEEAIQHSLEQGHTRYPVIRKSKDDIVGYVTLSNLIKASFQDKNQILDQLVEEPIIVLASTPIQYLLTLMRKNGKHIAILKDEYGGTSGMVTMEDILEELVGDIRDETDLENSFINKKDDGSYIISGKLTLDDFQRYFHVKLKIFEISKMNTLAGFIVEQAKIPIKAGQIFTFAPFTFEVIDYENAHINYIKVRRTTEPTKKQL